MGNDFKYNDIMRFINGEFKKVYAIEKYDGNEKKVIVPSIYNELDVYEIGNNSFSKNETIEEVVLPTSIGSIGSGVFSFCKNMKTINLDNVKYIDTSAFAYSGIEKLILNNISEIGMSAFSNCEKLTEIVICGDIKEIKSSTFINCKKLKRVILPDTIEKIGDNAFSGCKKIEEIFIPSTAKISKYAFEKNVLNIVKSSSKSDNKKIEYDLEYLLKETKKMNLNEIESYIKKLIKEHKLDEFKTTDITDMNNLSFDKETGELSWKCNIHGNCSCNLWNLLENKGKMISNFDYSGCGYCK